MRIGIIAGEVSGDIIAAGLIQELKKKYSSIEFIGIAGPLMQAQGCQAIYPMEKLSVMGFVEVIARYRELSRMQRALIKYFLKNPPDLFIGVDAPDFNLSIERQLKLAGIKTVHYVSPSVWAWRHYRIKKITQSVGLMLTLFPFEKRFYDNYQMPVKFVGHALADSIGLDTDKYQARIQLQLEHKLKEHHSLIAMLPGSRSSEVLRLSKPFIETAIRCQAENPDIIFIVPFVNQKIRDIFEKQMQTYQQPPELIMLDNQSQVAMAASDAVLLASGTATLEALLLKKPMLVAYKMSPLSYWLAKKLSSVPFFSLPNLLAGEQLVEELTQDDVNAENLTPKVINLLDSSQWKEKLGIFHDIHLMLKKDANVAAAQAISEYLEK